MGWFTKWKSKRKEKKETLDIKPPKSSYEIYNQNETLTFSTLDDDENLDKEYKSVYGKTNLDQKSNKKSKSRKTSSKSQGGENMAIAKDKGRNIYYVSARKDNKGKKLGWEVKKENANKITKLCDTKEEAIEFVKEKAGNQGSTCIIRKLDGSIDKTIKFEAK